MDVKKKESIMIACIAYNTFRRHRNENGIVLLLLMMFNVHDDDDDNVQRITTFLVLSLSHTHAQAPKESVIYFGMSLLDVM